MRLIKPSFEVLTPLDGSSIMSRLEDAGRTCYKSEDKKTDDGRSAIKLIKYIIDLGHESILEHESISVRFICNRGFTHELVRHRLCAYSQESTRYCNYAKDRFGKHVTFIIPPWVIVPEGTYPQGSNIPYVGNTTRQVEMSRLWIQAMSRSAHVYHRLIALEWKPEMARGVLPIDLKTEIVITTNIREWRHILKLRTSERAHPQMRELMVPLLKEFQSKVPVVFDDIGRKSDSRRPKT